MSEGQKEEKLQIAQFQNDNDFDDWDDPKKNTSKPAAKKQQEVKPA